MATGEHFVGAITDDRSRTIASHEWLLDHWSELMRYLVHGTAARPAIIRSCRPFRTDRTVA